MDLAPTNLRCSQSSNLHSVGPYSTTKKLVLAYPTSTSRTTLPVVQLLSYFTREKLYSAAKLTQSSIILASLPAPAI